jgi:hypothetical protein
MIDIPLKDADFTSNFARILDARIILQDPLYYADYSLNYRTPFGCCFSLDS